MFSAFLTVLISPMPWNIAEAIILFGIGYAILNIKLQRILTNPQKTREMQQKINQLTKEMNEMAKRNEDISGKQAELMPLMKQSMQAQMKSMVVILPLFFLVYYVILPFLFTPFSAGEFTLIVPLTYQALFIVTIILSGLVLSMMILIRDRMVAKRTKNLQHAPSASVVEEGVNE